MSIDDILSNLSKYKEKEPFSNIPEYMQFLIRAIKQYSGSIVFNLYNDVGEFDIIYHMGKIGYSVEAKKVYKYLSFVKVIEITYGNLKFYFAKVGKKGIIVQTDERVEWIVSEAIVSLLEIIQNKYGGVYMSTESEEGIIYMFEKADSQLKTFAENVRDAVEGPWFEDNVEVNVEGEKFNVKTWEKETESEIIVLVSVSALEDYIIEVLRKFFR